ncbi:hypothetical protein [Nocardia sp. CDC160]|uniref:hypothetical protein n=1 Tax=Nocardia sp. CDC160 TaxID=3112166 RepID=UPI002DC0360A|nr:hypothetical protein [Nocardia sp. CDC160]MEC3919015.1 hypothetical protein [Nocardia sp. CDC160]
MAKSVRAIGVLAVAGVVLGVADVVAPWVVAGSEFSDESGVRNGFRGAFPGYWNAGERELTPSLARVVDYWFRFHVAKGAIAAVLLVVLMMLAVVLWRAFLGAEGLGSVRRTSIAAGGVLVTALLGPANPPRPGLLRHFLRPTGRRADRGRDRQCDHRRPSRPRLRRPLRGQLVTLHPREATVFAPNGVGYGERVMAFRGAESCSDQEVRHAEGMER